MCERHERNHTRTGHTTNVDHAYVIWYIFQVRKPSLNDQYTHNIWPGQIIIKHILNFTQLERENFKTQSPMLTTVHYSGLVRF